MFDGKYRASINTPMGTINGTITLMSKEKNSVQGIIEMMGMKNSFNGMKMQDNIGKFSGKFNTPLGSIEYNATCTVINNKLELVANTNKGNFKIQGVRV